MEREKFQPGGSARPKKRLLMPYSLESGKKRAENKGARATPLYDENMKALI